MGNLPLLDELAVVTALAVAVTVVLSKLKLPTVAGLLAAGALLGPYGLKLATSVHAIEVLAEVGVVLLLFSIGLEFSLARLRSIEFAREDMREEQRVGVARRLSLARCFLRINHDEIAPPGLRFAVVPNGIICACRVGVAFRSIGRHRGSCVKSGHRRPFRRSLLLESQGPCRERCAQAEVPRKQATDFPCCLELSTRLPPGG